LEKIALIGIGPGAREYIIPAVYEKIVDCDVLLGSKRNLRKFDKYKRETLPYSGEFEDVLPRLEEIKKHKKVGIVVDGDPGFYSILEKLTARYGREGVDVIPGISSVQYLMAKASMGWEDLVTVNLFKDLPENIDKIVKSNKKVAFLTGKMMPPSKITELLMSKGVTTARVLIGISLSHSDERIMDIPIASAGNFGVSDLCVMVVYKERGY